MFNKEKNNDLMKQIEREAKKREIKAKVKYAIEDGLNWVYNHREPLMFITPVIVTGLSGGSKIISSVIRKAAIDKEQKLKDLRIYDHSLGKYHELKRKMSTKEAVEFARRRDLGERTISILKDMNLVK